MLRIGTLGSSRISQPALIEPATSVPEVIVAAAAARALPRAEAYALRHGLEKAYGSYEELIADPDIDAIYNPLPNSQHAKWSILCAEAGKPVLCEKPLASFTAEAQKMVDACTSRGVPFAEGFMYRFHPQAVKVKELIASGAIGTFNT